MTEGEPGTPPLDRAEEVDVTWRVPRVALFVALCSATLWLALIGGLILLRD